MKLSKIKAHLANAEAVNFLLPDGSSVPDHFHVTEVGVISKHFIDCGGTVRQEKVANFQLWNANDTEHRLKPGKLLSIIALSEKKLGMEDLEIEVEYQSGTIGKYGLDFNGSDFVLTSLHTACLAQEACGVAAKTEMITTIAQPQTACCTPGGGCC
ncbi:MAG: hypothetical protein JWP69_284 [Flaviaesturariibacter sp.]|nr:hypothetical protein [Flaviaesturariibacter sp.]